MADIKKSLVWQYFEPSDDNMSGTCNACGKVVKRSCGNTSNLIGHLQRAHRQEHQQLREMEERKKMAEATTNQEAKRKQPRVTTMFNRSTPYAANNPKVERLHSLLAQMFCKEGLSFRLVESASFKAFVQELDPRYVLPSRKTLSSKLIPELQANVKADIRSQLAVATTYAITTDMWTSVNNQSYMGVTAHWIDEDFKSQNKCLAVKPAAGSHTADFITTELNAVIDEWGLDRQKLHVVTDNAANVKKAVGQIPAVTWRPCFAHTLQLCLNGSLTARDVTDLPKIITKARNIVSHFRRSPLATTQLEKAQQQLGLPLHKLQQDCPTRWNSQVLMLDRLLEQRDAVSLVLTTITVVKNLNAQQWATAADLTEALRPFLDVTQEMSAASYPTLSMIIPVVDGLKHLLQAAQGGLDVLRTVMSRFLCDKFGDLFDDVELCAATVVDPRFKLLAFDTDARRAKAMDATIALMKVGAAAPRETTVETNTAATAVPVQPTSVWLKLESAKANAVAGATQVGVDDAVHQELNCYVATPVISRGDCPLEWWSTNSAKYPTLASVARRLLGVPATSVPTERLFSKAGNVVTKKRNCLSPSKADSIVFLMENLL